jgi:hypothetical protein
MTGGTITRISIDPVVGGCTTVQDGHPASILCAGYVGSTLMGGLFILGGFDTLAAKILSFVAAVGLIAPLSLVRDKLYVVASRVYKHRTKNNSFDWDTRVLEQFYSQSPMRVYWWDFGSLITRAHGLLFFG